MPLGAGDFVDCDLFVAVQHPELLGLVRRPRRLALWVVWPPGGFRRRHRAARLWWYRPRPVFVSDFQARAYPPGCRDRGRRSSFLSGCPTRCAGGPRSWPRRRRARSSPPIRSATCAGCSGSGRARSCRPFRGPSSTSTGFRDYAYRYGDPWEETESRLGQFVPDGFPAAGRASLRPAPACHARRALAGDARGPRHALRWAPGRGLLPLRGRSAGPRRAGRRAADRRPAGARARWRHRVRRGRRRGLRPPRDRLLTDDGLWRAQHEAALRLQQGWSWDQMAARFEAEVFLAPRRR